MGNKIKNFLFPNKEDTSLDTSTIVINTNELEQTETKTKTINRTSSPKIITPKVFSQVEEIANEILSGNDVIVDLTNANIDEAKRICDFLNGVTFAINGKVKKIAKLVYLFSPNNV